MWLINDYDIFSYHMTYDYNMGNSTEAEYRWSERLKKNTDTCVFLIIMTHLAWGEAVPDQASSRTAC